MVYGLIVAVACLALWIAPARIVHPFLNRRGISTKGMASCAYGVGTAEIFACIPILAAISQSGWHPAYLFLLVPPVLWYLVPTAVVSITHPRYLKRRKARLRAWREELPPQTRQELEEYFKLVADFPEYVIGKDAWRDPPSGLEWDYVWIGGHYCGLTEERGSLEFWLRIRFTEEAAERGWSDIIILLPASTWRDCEEVLLSAIREEGGRVRGRMREQHERDESAAQHRILEAQEADRRERAEVAAALEGQTLPAATGESGLDPEESAGLPMRESGSESARNLRDTSEPLRHLWTVGGPEKRRIEINKKED